MYTFLLINNSKEKVSKKLEKAAIITNLAFLLPIPERYDSEKIIIFVVAFQILFRFLQN